MVSNAKDLINYTPAYSCTSFLKKQLNAITNRRGDFLNHDQIVVLQIPNTVELLSCSWSCASQIDVYGGKNAILQTSQSSDTASFYCLVLNFRWNGTSTFQLPHLGNMKTFPVKLPQHLQSVIAHEVFINIFRTFYNLKMTQIWLFIRSFCC